MWAAFKHDIYLTAEGGRVWIGKYDEECGKEEDKDQKRSKRIWN